MRHSSAPDLMCWCCGSRRDFETTGDHRPHRKRCADAGNAGGPAKPIEELTQGRAADQAAKEIRRQIEATGGAAVRGRDTSDKARCDRLRKERPDANEDEPNQYSTQ